MNGVRTANRKSRTSTGKGLRDGQGHPDSCVTCKAFINAKQKDYALFKAALGRARIRGAHLQEVYHSTEDVSNLQARLPGV